MITVPTWLFVGLLVWAPVCLLVGAAAGAYFGSRMTYRAMNGESPVPELPLLDVASAVRRPRDERFGEGNDTPEPATKIKLPSVRG